MAARKIDPWSEVIDGIPPLVEIQAAREKTLLLTIQATRERLANAIDIQRGLVETIAKIKAGTLDPASLMITDEGVREIPARPVMPAPNAEFYTGDGDEEEAS